MTITLATLLKDSAYKLTQFKAEQIKTLEASITLKESGKKDVPYINGLVRGKPIRLTPEEAVRQLYVLVLRDDLGEGRGTVFTGGDEKWHRTVHKVLKQQDRQRNPVFKPESTGPEGSMSAGHGGMRGTGSFSYLCRLITIRRTS